jgi:hypothetical protein
MFRPQLRTALVLGVGSWINGSGAARRWRAPPTPAWPWMRYTSSNARSVCKIYLKKWTQSLGLENKLTSIFLLRYFVSCFVLRAKLVGYYRHSSIIHVQTIITDCTSSRRGQLCTLTSIMKEQVDVNIQLTSIVKDNGTVLCEITSTSACLLRKPEPAYAVDQYAVTQQIS